MARADQIIHIGTDERAVFVGRTGSGKTVLARALLSGYTNVVAIDEKAEFILPNATYASSPAELAESMNNTREFLYSPIIYRPEPAYWNQTDYDQVFRLIYQRRNTTVYVDEIYAVMKGSTFPHWYQAILTRGRSLQIRCISCTQRPVRIPISVLSESNHYCCFSLQWADDKQRMAELMTPDVAQSFPPDGENVPVEHSFWYYKVGGRRISKLYLLEVNENAGRVLSRGGNGKYAVR